MMFFLELKPILKCNQKCYYCDVHGKSKFENSIPVVDIDYVKFVLECHSKAELVIQISGGEIGLLSNLSEFFETILSFSNVKQIGIESNGLLRTLNFDFNKLPNAYYFEHLIFDINEKDVKTFYDLDFVRVNKNHRFVIVTTEKTVDSILNNFSYFKNNGFFKNKFWYKIIVPKSYDITFLKKLYVFYDLLNSYQNYKWELLRLNAEINNIDHQCFKNFCAINPPQPFVDFERKQLVHCGVVSERGVRFPFNKLNAELNLRSSLFKFADYCNTCHVYDYNDNKLNCILRSRKGDYCNRSYINVSTK
jgi:hypothetical protein